MVSPVSTGIAARGIDGISGISTASDAGVLKTIQPDTKNLARSENGGRPDKGEITTTPQFIRLMNKNPSLRQVPYADYAQSVRSVGGMPQPVRPGGAYFRVLNGPGAGRVVDLSTEKFPGRFMPAATKLDFMEYGFGQASMKKMGGVTFDQFAKAYSYYRQTLADSGGSNTGAVRGALKAYQDLGDKAFPDGLVKKAALVPTKVGDLSPYLQSEIRAGRMEFADAVQLMKRESTRRETMEDVTDAKSCQTRVEVRNVQSVQNGKTTTESDIYAYTTGSWQSQSTQTKLKVSDPQTKKKLGGGDSGVVPGNTSSINVETTMTRDYDQTKPSPKIKADGICNYGDGTSQKSVPTINVINQ